jgi:hypothetical protein
MVEYLCRSVQLLQENVQDSGHRSLSASFCRKMFKILAIGRCRQAGTKKQLPAASFGCFFQDAQR